MTETTVLSRRELYDLVWATPISKLALQFGVSDRGLAKICERHRIPTPPRGYWARLAAGGKPKQLAFVETQGENPGAVRIDATLSNIPDEAREILERAKQERKAEKREKSDQAALHSGFSPVEDIHPLLKATAKALRKANPKKSALTYVSGEGLATIWVASECVERLLSFLDKLIRQLLAKGFALEIVPQGIKASLKPDDVVFTVKERTKLVPHVPTPEELAAEKRRLEQIAKRGASWEFVMPARAYPEKDEVAMGELILQMDGYADGVRRRWADGKTQSLETMFDGIVTGFEVVIAARKAERLKHEEWQRQRAELSRRQHLSQQRRAREKKRREFLGRVLSDDREAAEICNWLSKFVNGEAHSDSADFSQFIGWAEARLDRLRQAGSVEFIQSRLREGKLFPEIDELHDPLGDPPRDCYYGGNDDD